MGCPARRAASLQWSGSPSARPIGLGCEPACSPAHRLALQHDCQSFIIVTIQDALRLALQLLLPHVANPSSG